MDRPILTPADFGIAFAYSRSEPAPYRDDAGVVRMAPADAPRFDHDENGRALGLLIGAGGDIGGRDRISLEPEMLPLTILPSPIMPKPPVTVLHCFDSGNGEERRAWYSRDPAGTVNALMRQVGHHKSIGIVPGFLPNRLQPFGELPALRGYVRYRDQFWVLPGIFASDGKAITDGEGRPLLEAGA